MLHKIGTGCGCIWTYEEEWPLFAEEVKKVKLTHSLMQFLNSRLIKLINLEVNLEERHRVHTLKINRFRIKVSTALNFLHTVTLGIVVAL